MLEFHRIRTNPNLHVCQTLTQLLNILLPIEENAKPSLTDAGHLNFAELNSGDKIILGWDYLIK